MRTDKIAVFGFPSAAGARVPGLIRAPQAFRQAGLLDALRATGTQVVDRSDLARFPLREDPDRPRCRNTEGVAEATRTVADEMTRALAEGFVLVLGGDCSLVAGTAAGARLFFERPIGLAYLDADADLNTDQTTPSGYMDGMALALALGHGPAEVVSACGPAPMVAGEHVALMGFRGLDPGERALVGTLAVAIPAAEIRRVGAQPTATRGLDAIANHGGPILVHVDVDLLDPAEMPVKTALPGPGLNFEEAGDLLAGWLASPRVVAMELVEYDPDRDPEGHSARRLIDLLARAFRARLERGGAFG